MSSYFAAANSGRGFVNCFENVFGKVGRLYVINGGPGTGKSRLMRELGEAAEANGHVCEYFYCSSDPASLDGVLIPSLDCAMIDGTAPHTWDIRCPGAFEQIVNLGEFWDAGKLVGARGEITRLNTLKKSNYAAAYSLLKAACELEAELDRIGSAALLTDKLNAAVSRLARSWTTADTDSEQIRITSGITTKGMVKLDIPGENAAVKYTVTGPAFAVRRIMNTLRGAAALKNTPRTVSLEPLNTANTDALYLKSEDVQFTSVDIADDADNEADGLNIINAWRFIDRDALKKVRGQLRFYERCRKSLVDAACEKLSSAGEHHAAVEEIYAQAMDFTKKAKYCAALVRKIVN